MWIVNFLVTKTARRRGALRKWLGRVRPAPPRGDADPDAAARATVVILNWKRPDNVRRILDAYVSYDRVGEILVWNNNRDAPFAYVHPAVRCINSDELGLNTRWAAALLGVHACVIVNDDDILCDEPTIDRLVAAHHADPDRTYTLHGRNPDEDNVYATFVDRVRTPTECEMHLTRVACTHRRFVTKYFEAVQAMAFDTDPAMGGGEDILFSYVVRSVTGKRPVVLPGRYTELLALHAIESRNGSQKENRTRLMRRCQERFGLGG